MSSPKTKVEEEIVLLDEKISKLKIFVNDDNGAYQFLADWNKTLLQDQLYVMNRYAEILRDRIKSWED